MTRNEIRLLGLLYDEDEPLHVEHLAADQFSKFKLLHVSLDDYLPPSKVMMDRFGTDTVRPKNTAQVRELFKKKLDDELVKTLWAGRWIWGDFCAISYLCGDPVTSKQVIVDGIKISVTDNLFDVLESLWLGYGPRIALADPLLWVDALCINQNDLDERNREVRRMGSIYGQAFQVVGWLGCRGEYILDGVDFIKRVSQTKISAIRESSVTHHKEVTNYREEDWLAAVLGVIETSQERHVLGFADILASPYWTRLWILQEANLGQEQIIFAGSGYDLSRFEFEATLRSFQSSKIRRSFEPFWSRSQTFDSFAGQKKLSEGLIQVRTMIEESKTQETSILETASQLEQSDPKDKIFAILSCYLQVSQSWYILTIGNQLQQSF